METSEAYTLVKRYGRVSRAPSKNRRREMWRVRRLIKSPVERLENFVVSLIKKHLRTSGSRRCIRAWRGDSVHVLDQRARVSS
jgi:hypothetical protein